MFSFFSSGREVRFHVRIVVHKLQAIPFRHGRLFLKFKAGGGRSEVSEQVAIGADNCAEWESLHEFDVKMSVDNKTNVLKTYTVDVAVKHVRLHALRPTPVHA